ncbi:hypothetical protein [Roseateles sp.]|uniref:hypothetical protein n=1 Tax=Roseateles sp. TaxID=1971397 RepID=UPI003D13E01A
MSWVLFFLLVALHPVAFVLIARADMTRAKRVFFLAALFVPGSLYSWDYFAIQYEHEKLCEAEAGLKVLIQPEKVDRIRVMPGAPFDKYLLEEYFPRIKIVEALTDKRDPKTGAPLLHFEAYTAVLNPKAGQWLKGLPQEGKLLFSSTRVDELDPNMFELSKVESRIAHGTKTEVILSKNGKVYARHTEFVHWWTGIQYPDALPTWRCPKQIKSPPKDEPNAPYENWPYPPSASAALGSLIFK